MKLDPGWSILQDVYDTCEELGLPEREDFLTDQGAQVSEWEELPQLKHLQLLFAEHPYWGRELRYFNEAPWWYKNEFTVPADEKDADRFELFFSNADYYCKVWLNGKYLGFHEGYSAAFSLDATEAVKRDGMNRLLVKVWSPWETDIRGGRVARRTFEVERNLVKGTYEHYDTFIARDVNPVGIYGDVELRAMKTAWFAKRPVFSYELAEDLSGAALSLDISVAANAQVYLRAQLRDDLTGLTSWEASEVLGTGSAQETNPQQAPEVPSAGSSRDPSAAPQFSARFEGRVEKPALWSTWDKGAPNTYTLTVTLLDGDGRVLDSYEELAGFRKIDILRTTEETCFILNGKRLYVRGTSYFPDSYVSAMHEARYRDDLLKIKQLGFNLVRVHVHVEKPVFYRLCTELGMGIMQDSEYNWTHPVTEEYMERFMQIYLENVDQLKVHPSMLCWICMNEPGALDGDAQQSGEVSKSPLMEVYPGPQLYEALRRHDPSRPAIKGSYCSDDPFSGDSHNYTGSLNGEDGHYTDIFGTTEKLNTEYGFDALPPLENLERSAPVLRRYLRGAANGIEKPGLPETDQPAGLTPAPAAEPGRYGALREKILRTQEYQYRLLKYYTEHYRMQKYAPNAGYVQFLFSDIGPTSFYGLYDWYGTGKKGAEAMFESNQPVGIFLEYNREELCSVFAVNDGAGIGTCEAEIIVTAETAADLSDGVPGRTETQILFREKKTIDLAEDCILRVFRLQLRPEGKTDVRLILRKSGSGEILSANRYEDLFSMPVHVPGHPARMSHEFGIRLYDM